MFRTSSPSPKMSGKVTCSLTGRDALGVGCLRCRTSLHLIFPARQHVFRNTFLRCPCTPSTAPRHNRCRYTCVGTRVFYSGSVMTSTVADLSDLDAMWSHRLSVTVPGAIPLSSLSIIVLFPRNFGFSLHVLFDGDRTAGLE